MREIKFRAWCPSAERMFICYGFNQKAGQVFLPCSEELHPNCVMPDYLSSFILMQYTGLKDKNGVEIYEGDIVKREKWHNDNPKDCIALIYWNKSQLNFSVSSVGDSSYWRDITTIKLEVIGNIYENKELLNG